MTTERLPEGRVIETVTAAVAFDVDPPDELFSVQPPEGYTPMPDGQAASRPKAKTNIVWMDVMRQIAVFRPYSCRCAWEYDGPAPASRQVMRLSLARRREVRPDGSIFIVDLSQSPNRTLALKPAQKLAVEETLSGTGPRQDPDFLRILAGMSDGDATDLDVKTIEGRQARGFHRPDPVNEFTVWADVETGLPIRIECVQRQLARRLILDQFDFDTPLDESLFDTSAPAGYYVQNGSPPGPAKP